MKNVVIVALDGTLARVGNRSRMKKKDSYLFHDRCNEDSPEVEIIDIVRNLMATGIYQFYFYTTRPDEFKKKTSDWINCFVFKGKYPRSKDYYNKYLLMKKGFEETEGDKIQLILDSEIRAKDIAFVIDNDPEVRERFKKMRIKVLRYK